MAAAVVEGLPEELLTLILSKLPVKSLLRCKCVQKSWYYLIKSPRFIHFHRSSSSSKNWDCFIVSKQQPQNVLSLYSYETLEDLGNDITIPITKKGSDVSLTGPCDGLVCITNHRDQILICNPATREFRSLLLPPSVSKRDSHFRSIDSIAFGSDPNTAGGQYYKLLMISSMFGHKVTEANMYDFRTDSWRETETAVVIENPFRYRHQAVSLNGVFHWCPRGSFEENILTFNISDEVTGSMPLPDFRDLSHVEWELFVSSKSQLALVARGSRGEFEICVMTKYGVKESWTRLFKIWYLGKLYYPLAFWGEQQLLMYKATWDRQLVSCDFQHQNVRRFPIKGDLNVYPCSLSLVSVHGIGRELL